ncbi:MAG TPA: DNA internalization-related competence protein ComEC/Rec2 [Leucothrix mucor]|nr:DNA internalization-related competence protein ComEC/Rec2 [Leucothrix mucor]
MRIAASGFFFGTFILQFLSELPSVAALLVLLFLISLSYLFNLYHQPFKNTNYQATSKLLLAFLLSAILSSLYATVSANSIINTRITSSFEGKDLLVEGVVANIPERQEKNWRFYLDVSAVKLLHGNTGLDESISLKGKIKLGWYHTDQLISAGQTLRLQVRLKRPNGFMNKGGFDYEKWLFTQRVKATGYVRKSSENRVLHPAPWYAVNHWREQLQQKIKQTVSDKNSAAIIAALAVASRNDISEQQWTLFRQTGTSHLIAISGLHIGMVAGFAYLLVAVIFWLFPALYEQIPVRIAGAFLAIVFATAYAVLAGFTLPTQRSLIMVCGIVIALVQRQHLQSYKILSLALILVLLIDPFAAMTASFWLSFTAVFFILLYANRQQKKPRFSLIYLQFMLSIGMFPLTILFFGSASLVSPIANLVAIPWVTIIIVPLILLSLVFMFIAPWLSDYLLQFVALNIDYLMQLLAWLDTFPYASLGFQSLSTPLVFTMMLAILFLFLPKGFPARWLGILLLIPVFSYQTETVRHQGEFEYTLLDVGQGLASVIKTKHHVLVYDTGPRANNRFDTGKLVVLPYLQASGIKALDKMIISHEDIDHRGGMIAILNEIPAEKIISSNTRFLDNRLITKCRAGDTWQWDGVSFEFLHPDDNFDQDESDNNLSCVLKVWNQYHSLLLVGDIEKKTERYLLENNIEKLKAEVLLVPHHGSRTSSTQAFLNAVDPKLALNSRGYRNKFRHPAKDVVQRYQGSNIPMLDNVEQGAITVLFPNNDKPFELGFFREDNLRFWYREKHVPN